MQVTLRALGKGVATRLPVLSGLASRTIGATDSGRYCYSVWLRHLRAVAACVVVSKPRCVAELGPGDSLGIGLSAVLRGAERYFALDRRPFANFETNVRVFEELAEPFRRQAPTPDQAEFPGLYPRLTDYSFLHGLLEEDWLARCPAPQRLAAIRKALIPDPRIRWSCGTWLPGTMRKWSSRTLSTGCFRRRCSSMLMTRQAPMCHSKNSCAPAG
jgi:hypothetical protein